jgi:hypothetical protein
MPSAAERAQGLEGLAARVGVGPPKKDRGEGGSNDLVGKGGLGTGKVPPLPLLAISRSRAGSGDGGSCAPDSQRESWAVLRGLDGRENDERGGGGGGGGEKNALRAGETQHESSPVSLSKGPHVTSRRGTLPAAEPLLREADGSDKLRESSGSERAGAAGIFGGECLVSCLLSERERARERTRAWMHCRIKTFCTDGRAGGDHPAHVDAGARSAAGHTAASP